MQYTKTNLEKGATVRIYSLPQLKMLMNHQNASLNRQATTAISNYAKGASNRRDKPIFSSHNISCKSWRLFFIVVLLFSICIIPSFTKGLLFCILFPFEWRIDGYGVIHHVKKILLSRYLHWLLQREREAFCMHNEPCCCCC